jgi:hypothetical protein
MAEASSSTAEKDFIRWPNRLRTSPKRQTPEVWSSGAKPIQESKIDATNAIIRQTTQTCKPRDSAAGGLVDFRPRNLATHR